MAQFQHSTHFEFSADVLWAFIINPKNIERCSPPDTDMQLLSAPAEFTHHSRYQFRVRAMGQSRDSEHEVTGFDEGHSFTETQITGPLKSWQHTHIVVSAGEDQCDLIDQIEFKPPGGLAGLLVNEAFIKKHLGSAFQHRDLRIQELLSAEQA